MVRPTELNLKWANLQTCHSNGVYAHTFSNENYTPGFKKDVKTSEFDPAVGMEIHIYFGMFIPSVIVLSTTHKNEYSFLFPSSSHN